MNILLNRFYSLRDKVLKERNTLTPIVFFKLLREWANEVKNSKDRHLASLYCNYLLYYESFDKPELYDFSHLKNSFQTLLDYSFFRPNPGNTDHAVTIVANLLWNLIAFRSERLCPEGPHGYLRVLTNEAKSAIYFSCDVTPYIEDIDGKQINPPGKLIVANAEQIAKYKIKSSEDWDI